MPLGNWLFCLHCSGCCLSVARPALWDWSNGHHDFDEDDEDGEKSYSKDYDDDDDDDDDDGDDGDAGDNGDGDESDDEEEEEVDKQGKLANLLARTLADLLWPLACLTPFKFNLYFHLNSDERQTCPTSYLQGWENMTFANF